MITCRQAVIPYTHRLNIHTVRSCQQRSPYRSHLYLGYSSFSSCLLVATAKARRTTTSSYALQQHHQQQQPLKPVAIDNFETNDEQSTSVVLQDDDDCRTDELTGAIEEDDKLLQKSLNWPRANSRGTRKILEGSFANPATREKYGVQLSEIDHEELGGSEQEEAKRFKRQVAFVIGYLGSNYGG